MSEAETAVTSGEVVTGGFRTRYLEAAPARRPDGTVLLVHDGAFGAGAAVTWSEVLPALARRFHVVAPDLLGYGGTDKAVFFDRSPYDFRIGHLASFCAALDLDEVHAVGSSFGGSLLLRAAAERPRRLPLVSVTSIAGTGGPWRDPGGAAGLASYDGTEADVERIVRLMADDYAGLPAQVRARYLNTLLPGHIEACNAPRLLRSAAPKPQLSDGWPEPLRDSDVPVLLVAGRRDQLLDRDWTSHFDGLPGVSAVEMDARHAPNLDRPQELVEVLTEFFSSLPAEPRDPVVS